MRTTACSTGFIPGEAAAAVLLAGRAHAERQGWPILATVAGGGEAVEPGHLGASEPHRGDGWAAAMRAAQPALPTGIRTTYLSFTGEAFWAKEWGVAAVRHRPSFAEPLTIRHPAEALGDTGAACGVLMTALACWPHPRHPMATTLVLAADDGPARSALVLLPVNAVESSHAVG